jgi:cytochrome c-type biogenesis protein CcmH/NrfG
MEFTARNKSLCAGALICMATVLAYGNVIHNDFVSYDDVRYLFENNHVRSGLSVDGILWALTATYDGNWFPLTWISHMADMSMFGPSPLGHHLVSLGLHILNSLLLMWILVRTTGYLWRGAIVAALFALHPLHVESVVWAAERKDVLSTLLFMLTIAAYTRYVADRTVFRYLSVVVLYACGLAAKPMLVSLPCVLLLLDFWPLGRWMPGKIPDTGSSAQSFPKLVGEKIPLAVLAAASCLITIIVQSRGGAMNEPGTDSLAVNAAHAVVNYSTYLYKAVWPADLAVLYPYVASVSVWKVTGSVALLSFITVMALRQWQKRPYCAVGWFWFLITMLPVIGLVRVGLHSTADRYTYIPITGLFIIAVWATADLLVRYRRGAVTAALLVFPLFSILGIATWKQTAHWKNASTLFEQALRVTSDNWVAHNSIASEMIKQGMYRQALRHVQEAIRINPSYTDAYMNLGGALSGLDDLRGAIDAYKEALLHQPQPQFVANAYYMLSMAYSYAGNMKQALETCEILRQLDPASADVLEKNLFIAARMQRNSADNSGSEKSAIIK